jgi:tol-pal system protein YbgF
MALQLAARLQEHETELQRLREAVERLQGQGDTSQTMRNLQDRVATIERQLRLDAPRSGAAPVVPPQGPRVSVPSTEPRPEAQDPPPPPGRVAVRPPVDGQGAPVELQDTPVPAEEKLFRDGYALLTKGAEKLFRDGYALLTKGATDQAAATFEDLLQKYPKGLLTADALYWIGECRFAQRRYDEAVLQFDRVLKEFPGSKKELDALLKQGQSFEKMGDRKSARIIFQKLVNDFPHTAQARLAVGRLKALPQE